jgi:16S rRNA U1498 N3-methylase RsmE
MLSMRDNPTHIAWNKKRNVPTIIRQYARLGHDNITPHLGQRTNLRKIAGESRTLSRHLSL